MISTLPCLYTPTQEYVVPRSIPITVPLGSSLVTCVSASANIKIDVRILLDEFVWIVDLESIIWFCFFTPQNINKKQSVIKKLSRWEVRFNFFVRSSAARVVVVHLLNLSTGLCEVRVGSHAFRSISDAVDTAKF